MASRGAGALCSGTMIPGVEHRRFASFDGTEIAYQVRGEGPAIVLANGLGGTHAAWRHVYEALGDGYRIVSWDYRGLYDSGPPPSSDALSMQHQVRDLELLLEREGIERAVLVGWSMGVQVNFEFLRRHAPRVDGVVAINGTAGLPFRTALASRAVRFVIPVMLQAVKAQARVLGAAAQRAVAWDGLIPLMQRAGFVGRTLDMEVFRAIAEGVAGLDLGLYSDTLAHLGRHDARDVLPKLDLPVLIVTGERDRMTPSFTARSMHRAIRGARLVIIADGTHYTPVEYPEVVSRELRGFLGRIPGYAPSAAAGARNAR